MIRAAPLRYSESWEPGLRLPKLLCSGFCTRRGRAFEAFYSCGLARWVNDRATSQARVRLDHCACGDLAGVKKMRFVAPSFPRRRTAYRGGFWPRALRPGTISPSVPMSQPTRVAGMSVSISDFASGKTLSTTISGSDGSFASRCRPETIRSKGREFALVSCRCGPTAPSRPLLSQSVID